MNGQATSKTPGYSHTQQAPLCLILDGAALCCFAVTLLFGDTPGIYIIIGGMGLVLAVYTSAVHHLTVVDQGEAIAVRFGTLRWFHRTVKYAAIEKVEVGRTPILDGWGIHYSFRVGGWVWNLWGRDCVILRLWKGVLVIGTDDSGNLARFLEGKVSHQRV